MYIKKADFNPKSQQTFNLSVEQTKNFNALYSKHFNMILNYIKFKVKNVEDAEEICINAFEKACRYLDTYNESKSKITTWLVNITNGCISNFYRVSHADKYISATDFENDEKGVTSYVFEGVERADVLAESKDFQHTVANAFRTLRPNYRKIATLYFLRELEYAEIAEICDIPIGTVKGTISRCRAILQTELSLELAM